MCIFPPVKLLYNLPFAATWQENTIITIKSNLRSLPISEICLSLKWDWNNLWGFYSQIRMEIIPQRGIDFCKTASIIYFLISSHSWNNVIIVMQHRKFSATWRFLQRNVGKRRILQTHKSVMELKLKQNEVNATLNLAGTSCLILLNDSPHVLFVDWHFIHFTLGRLPW